MTSNSKCEHKKLIQVQQWVYRCAKCKARAVLDIEYADKLFFQNGLVTK